jgi:hypothetical protein
MVARRGILILGGGVAAAAAIVIVVVFRHGAQSINCDSLLVRATVLDLVKKKSPLPNNTDYELDSIRQTGENTAGGSVSCAAKVFGEFNNAPYSSASLTYTVTRQADGQIVVSVEGISGLRIP